MIAERDCEVRVMGEKIAKSFSQRPRELQPFHGVEMNILRISTRQFHYLGNEPNARALPDRSGPDMDPHSHRRKI